MKITKYVHACLVVEEAGKAYLFDPGQFSWESGTFDIAGLNRLDGVVITHEHFDHFHPPFVQALLDKFPETPFVTTPTVAEKLRELGAKNVSTDSQGDMVVFSKKQHASLDPLGQAPENVAVHLLDRLTVGGDRHDLEESKEILALTVTAPWGSMMDAAGMALRLKPKVMVPVHDWHWNDTARQAAYDTLEGFFKQHDITFLKPTDGQPLEIPT